MASNNKREFIYDEIKSILTNTGLNFLRTYNPSKNKSYKRPFVFLDVGDESEPTVVVENSNAETGVVSVGVYFGYGVDADTGDDGLLTHEGDRIIELLDIAIKTGWASAWFTTPSYKMKLENFKYSVFLRIDDKSTKGDGLLLGDVTYTRTWTL